MILITSGYRQTDRRFFERDVLEVAPDLLGCRLSRSGADGTVAIRITEVEAYAGERDPGAHSFRGKTARNATLFGPAGHIYCYFSYGLHHAINLVTTAVDKPYGCLIRAGRVVEGEELARARRESGRRSPVSDRDLARGPGRVAQVFGATLADDGDDLFGGEWEFLIPDAPLRVAPATGPRVGVSGVAGDGIEFPWRFWVPGDPTVSAYRPGKSRVASSIRVRRVYDAPDPGDGTRVLVDRLWPRGVGKQRAQLDHWSKVVAPSTELRRWYEHVPERFDGFRTRYLAELQEPERAAELQHLRDLAASAPLTLLTATKDVALSEAAVIAQVLRQPPAR